MPTSMDPKQIVIRRVDPIVPTLVTALTLLLTNSVLSLRERP